jgi:hypothetical protein
MTSPLNLHGIKAFPMLHAIMHKTRCPSIGVVVIVFVECPSHLGVGVLCSWIDQGESILFKGTSKSKIAAAAYVKAARHLDRGRRQSTTIGAAKDA